MSEVGMLDQHIKNHLGQNPGELSSLEGNIAGASEGKEIRSILVTSCHSSEGKTVSSISMAHSFSTTFNARVLLVDGHFKSPKIHEFFQITGTPGLSELLSSSNSYDEVIRPTEFGNLKIMPSGSQTDTVFDIFKRGCKDHLLSLVEGTDYLILDGYPVFGSSDISAVLRLFDGIILVVECEKTRWEVVRMAKDKITKAGGTILGVLLNKRKFYIPKALYDKG